MQKKSAHLKPKNTKTFLALASLFLATLIWAAATPVIRLTLQYIPVFTFLLYRFLIVCTILLPFVLIELKRNPIHKKDIPKIILLGIFGQSSIMLIFIGLKYTTALDTAIIGILAPILSIAAGHYFYREKVDMHIKIGVSVATLGTAIVVLEPIFTEATFKGDILTRLAGNLFVVGYSIMFLMYIIWSKMILGQHSSTLKKSLRFLHIKPMKRSYSAILITMISFYIGLLTFIPFAVLENLNVFGKVNIILTALPLTPILGILYMALISSIVAYFAFEWALNHASVGDAAIFNYLAPLLTVPFAYLLLNELPNTTMLIGSFVIATGVVIAEYKKS